MGRYPEADFSRLAIGPAAERPTKVRVEDFSRPLDPRAARAVLESLPRQLAGLAFPEVVARVVRAHRASRPVVAMCGGHVVKVGVSPCLLALMEHGVITHLALNGAALGETAMRDFRILARTLAEVRGAVVLNLGSAVLLPEVFLKALSVARNLGADLSDLTTVNFDQIQHYRPRVNVVERPTRAAGARGYALTGHHEILIPLFAGAVLAELEATPASPHTSGGRTAGSRGT